MSPKTVCFLLLLIVSLSYVKSVNNLKKVYLASKKSIVLPKSNAEVALALTQVASKLKRINKTGCTVPDTPIVSVGPGGPTIKNVSAQAFTGAPGNGCIWIYVHCGVLLSKEANGIYELCADEIEDVDIFDLSDMTKFGSVAKNPLDKYTMTGNISGFRVGPDTTVSFWQGTKYTGQTQNTSEPDFFNLCNPDAQPLGQVWNDRPRSLKITQGHFSGTVNNNPATNVSKTSLATGPKQGCVWIFIHCSVDESRQKLGVYNFCQNTADLKNQNVENITNFDYIFGTVGNRSLSGNVSGSITGPNTLLRIYSASNYGGDSLLLNVQGNSFVNYCNAPYSSGAIGSPWNDKTQSFKLFTTGAADLN
jgi:hypothetical protein